MEPKGPSRPEYQSRLVFFCPLLGPHLVGVDQCFGGWSGVNVMAILQKAEMKNLIRLDGYD
jgi:hypothetical protein